MGIIISNTNQIGHNSTTLNYNNPPVLDYITFKGQTEPLTFKGQTELITFKTT